MSAYSIIITCLTLITFPFALLYYFFKQLFRWINYNELVPNLHKKVVIVSGCDSGFGYEYVLKMASRHRQVRIVAGCLTSGGAANLQSALDSMLLSNHGDNQSATTTALPVDIKILDITNEKSVAQLYRFVKDDILSTGNYEIFALINNAGVVGQVGPMEWLQTSDFEKCLQVNLFGHVRMTQTFLPHLIASGGRLIFTASAAGKAPLPNVIPYTVSKYSLVGYADSLRASHWIRNPLTISTILPGAHSTSIVSVSARNKLVDNRWEKLDDNTKKLAPKEIITKGVQNIEKFAVINNVQDVIDAYIHASISKYPYQEYWIGAETPMVRLGQFMPAESKLGLTYLAIRIGQYFTR